MERNEVLIKVEGLSKKFCKNLKTSLWYGVKDLISNVSTNQDKVVLRKHEFLALEDINFELKRGECLGLVGHNGAGKSTLLKILNGLINPDSGMVTMHGRVGALIELGTGFNPILTGRENIYNNGAILGFTKKEIKSKIENIIDFSEIREFIDMPVQNYSSGMKVRLGFAVAAQMEPDILIIDEVLAVGDIGFRFKCLNAISKLMKNSAVIFVSHSMPMIYRVCNKVMLMDHGKNVLYTNNIGLGVEKYYEMFQGGQQNVVGSGDAIVESFEFWVNGLNGGLGDTLQVPYGDKILIKMGIYLNPTIADASVQIVFWNQEMLPVADVLTSNLDGFIVKNNESGHHSLSISIPHINFNAGKHAISIIINSKDLSTNYCRFDNAGFVNMTSHFASGSQILIKGEWNQMDNFKSITK